MPQKIFYSWQSDTPPQFNRSFVEKALKAAINQIRSDANLELASRDIEFDKDTQNVPGSPPIAETILRKIEQCAVLVADLTFIGESKGENRTRLIPNPNVLIEYGYALRHHGHGRLIGIMNTAFGAATSDTLPFDLRHLRWPISYELNDATSPEDKKAQYQSLVRRLAEALRLILDSEIVAEARVANFIPRKPIGNAAQFFDDENDLLPKSGGRIQYLDYVVPDEGRAYLRLYPTNAVAPFESELEAVECARSGLLEPMGEVSGWGYDRNIFGAIAHAAIAQGRLYSFTQLFLSREIWGLDAFAVNATVCREFTNGRTEGYIPTSFVEKGFVKTLRNYLKFAKAKLNLKLPLHVEAGFVGIKDYPIALKHGMKGAVLTDAIQWEGEILSYEMPAHEILRPFFAFMWAKCGVVRGTDRDAELLQELERDS